MLLSSAVIFSTSLLGAFLPAKAATNNWTVDDDGLADFHTIQEAINAAGIGDTVIVYAGSYNESVNINKTLTLASQSGPLNTIISLPNSSNPNPPENLFNVTANNVTISGFTITAIVGWGSNAINLDNVRFCNISNNICYGNGIGIHLLQSSYNTIINNDVSDNQRGMYLHESNHNLIMNNTAARSTYSAGITLVFSSNNQILNNTANSNINEGIYLLEQPTTNNLIANNTVNSNSNYGLHAFAAYDNKIVDNVFSDNGNALFLRGASKNNEILNNTILNNGVGLFLGDPENELGDCSNNTIYHNNFLSNTQQTYVYQSASIWDNGSISGGNYWTDYNGTDADNDGIGDSPYVIDANNVDRYPLMAPTTPIPTPTPEPNPTPSPTPTSTPTPSNQCNN